MAAHASSNRAFFNQLRKYYTWYTGGFIVFLVVLAILEQMGLPRKSGSATSFCSRRSVCTPGSAS